MSRLYFLLFFPFYSSCQLIPDNRAGNGSASLPDLLRIVQDIPLPVGYKRIHADSNTFGAWLRKLPLKRDKEVRLFDGRLKENQSAQFAVLDISVGEEDLQHCADAVMRLRAEYLFSQKRYAEILFTDNAGKCYAWRGGHDRTAFDRYLRQVFGMCGTASLEKQLPARTYKSEIQLGDVWIKGGFPGHAMIVIDVAANDKGEQIFMLAQSYMPAQDIHIVVNPQQGSGDPWYKKEDDAELVTPEWTFLSNQLRKWQTP